MDSTRVDKWLWAVRAYKTRSAASTACQAGHVDVNGSGAKPATSVRVGDRVTVRVAGRGRDPEGGPGVDKRGGAPLAAVPQGLRVLGLLGRHRLDFLADGTGQ